MPNDEGMNKCRKGRSTLSFVIWTSSLFRHSDFIICLIHIALVALIALEFLNVFIGLFDALAALLLHDFAQSSIDVFGHPARVATHKKVRAFGVDPIPNFSGIFLHP